ncbi:type III-B CRISPR module RAMP protein Cmr4 [Nitratireductor sp. XY-223]|uniref:type III-B CRISPR module RAMP protein Cmr4 n=1 Tax=Nitratireductor sp. XY-223 TaxID=2561926 RepID=UPI0010A9D7D2|nr:type III-B CRISPR module RAMP protein Cmr4 [Nitratireductor sp. XY-223]
MHETSRSTLLFVHGLTAMHPGGGTATGVVDLPVQRERHTRWPTVPGSTLKGVLRATCAADEDWTRTAFGPPPQESGSPYAGALSFSDARLLAFPVRSLKGVFAWTTCPAVLERLRRDLSLAGRPDTDFPDVPQVSGDRALCPQGSPLLIDPDGLMLEEFDFRREASDAGAAAWIADRAIADPATAGRLRNRLVVLPDDAFCHFASHATEVSARIGLDSETGTVRDGALFWEEYLPPETLFYAMVTAGDSRREDHTDKAADILRRLREALPDTLQIGGNATLGKGLCAVRLAPREGEQC